MKARQLFFSPPLLFCLSLISSNLCLADQATTMTLPTLPEQHCAQGSHQNLYQQYTAQGYVVFAQGHQAQEPEQNSQQTAHPKHDNDFADTAFLLSPDMSLFFTVALTHVTGNEYSACVVNAAQEIDFQFAAPIANLLTRKKREHLIFLNQELPKDTPCATQNNTCLTWAQWSPLLQQTLILSAYAFADDNQQDPYKEKVELTLENKTLRPTRGRLSEHARIKYALRLRNELRESAQNIKEAKEAYKQIHAAADHKLPLILFSITENRQWAITSIDRHNGLAETLLQGERLELYPMQNAAYKALLTQQPEKRSNPPTRLSQ